AEHGQAGEALRALGRELNLAGFPMLAADQPRRRVGLRERLPVAAPADDLPADLPRRELAARREGAEQHEVPRLAEIHGPTNHEAHRRPAAPAAMLGVPHARLLSWVARR